MDCIDSQSGERLSMEALHCTCGTMEKRGLIERVDEGKDCCRRSGVFLLESLARYSWLAILLMLLGNIAQTHQGTYTQPRWLLYQLQKIMSRRKGYDYIGQIKRFSKFVASIDIRIILIFEIRQITSLGYLILLNLYFSRIC